MSYQRWDQAVQVRGLVCDRCGKKVEVHPDEVLAELKGSDVYPRNRNQGYRLKGWHIGTTAADAGDPSGKLKSGKDLCVDCLTALVDGFQPLGTVESEIVNEGDLR